MASPLKLVPLAIVLIIAIYLFFSSWYLVSPTEKAIIIRLGSLSETVRDEGFYIKAPFIDDVKFADMRVNKADEVSKSASKDLQNVSTTISVNYSINPARILDLYRTVSLEHEQITTVVFSSAIQESVKRATAQYTAEELVTQREKVRTEIETALKDKVEKYGLIISQVNIVNFDFSQSFDEAIEAKVKAEQDALASKNKLEQVKYEAEQQVTRATAEATTIRIQAEAITKQGGAEYVKLKWIEKWNGALPTTSLAEGSVPLIQL